MERTYTEPEVLEIAVKAAKIALSQQPVPSAVTMKGAADMLGVSVRTVARMNLPRNGAGRIPYSAVVEAMAAKR